MSTLFRHIYAIKSLLNNSQLTRTRYLLSFRSASWKALYKEFRHKNLTSNAIELLWQKMIFTLFLLICCAVFFEEPAFAKDETVPFRPNYSDVVFDENPFWKQKKALYRRIKEERAIIVSVKVKPEKDSKQKKLIILGGGLINLPQADTFTEAKKLENLSKMSDYVIKSDWQPKLDKFFMHSKAFGYHAKMWMNVNFNDNKDFSEVRWKIVNGTFKGMDGVIRFIPVNSRQTEIGIQAEYDFEKLPIPQFFVEFGLEVAMQKMAARMRGYFESKLKTGKVL